MSGLLFEPDSGEIQEVSDGRKTVSALISYFVLLTECHLFVVQVLNYEVTPSSSVSGKGPC